MLILQVTTAAVEQYTGEGKPPFCEMTVRASDACDFTLPVTLIGVKQPTTITLERASETTDGVVRSPVTPLPKSSGMCLYYRNIDFITL